MSIWAEIRADLGELARNPRRWWYNATHAPCPVCGQSMDLAREMADHKATHDPDTWRAAVAGRTRDGSP